MPRLVVPIDSPSSDRRIDDLVLGHVPGHHQVGPLADPQIVLAANAPLGQRVDLVEHRRRVDDDARRDQVLHLRMQNAAGDVVQLVGLVAGDHGMPRIGAALIADDEVKLWCQQVDEFPFGLIAPLQTDHTGSSHHKLQKFRTGCRRDRSQRKRKSVSRAD